jgi:long-subunit fatty acid transport protein
MSAGLVAVTRSLFVLALFASAAHANGAFETYGADVRMRAMGNAGTTVDDVAAAQTNPALVGRGPGALDFEAGFSLDVPTTSVTFTKAKADTDPLSAAIPQPVAGYSFGLTLPVDLVLEDRLLIGVVAYFPTDVLVRARAYDPEKPFYYTYDSYTDHYDLSVAAGAKIVDWLYLGVGLRLAAGQSGVISLALDPVRGRLTQQSADTFQFPTAALTAGIVLGPLGVHDVVEGNLGVVYRDKSEFDIHLPATLGIDGANINALLDVTIPANFEPRTITAGTSFTIVKDLTLSVDGQYVFWHEAPPPLQITVVKLSGAGLDALGLSGALDAPAPGQNRVVSPGFVDTVDWRAGLEYRALKGVLALRAGYQYRPTPVPDQTSGTNIIDCNTHVVTAGFGVTFLMPHVFARPVTIDAAYQAHILEPRSVKKSNPNDPVGDWTATGLVHALAVGWTYHFD